MTARPNRTPNRRIDSCVDCGAVLPLCESLIPSESRTWLCGVCGREYKGQLAPDYSVDALRNLRPEPVMFDRSKIAPPSALLLETARKLQAIPDHDFRDKRQSSRYNVSMLVPTQAFDELLRTVDLPAMSVGRNISKGGICLLCERAVCATFLGLELTGPGGDLFQILVQVMRSRPRNSVHEIGGEFIARMAATTTRVLR